MTARLHSPIQPPRGWRNMDAAGSGHFGASRDGGKRKHLGADAIAVAGEPVYSPIDGVVDSLGWAYPDGSYRLVSIKGTGAYEAVRVRLLYVEPSVTHRQAVRAGEMVGVAQDIARRYVGITPHIHVEVWQAVDPTGLMARQ